MAQHISTAMASPGTGPVSPIGQPALPELPAPELLRASLYVCAFPADLHTARPGPLHSPAMAFGSTPSQIVDAWGTISAFPLAAGNHFYADGLRFELVGAHYHVPSAHSFLGRHHPGEMHVVGVSAQEATTIIAIPVRLGPASHGWAPLLDTFATVDHMGVIGTQLPWHLMVPPGFHSYRYLAPAPGANTQLTWYVHVPGITMSADQLTAMGSRHHTTGNVRLAPADPDFTCP